MRVAIAGAGAVGRSIAGELLENGHEGVNATVAYVGRREKEHPLCGEIRRHEVARAPRAEV